MILSDKDIRKFLKEKEISISPFDPKRLKPGSYTLTLGNTLMKPEAGKVVDAGNPKVKYNKVKIPKSGFIIQPDEFFIGQTKERISISTKLACVLDTRTTLARIGLTALQGSTFIEPGQSESHETLEIKNVSGNDIRVFPGMKVVKCIFVILLSESQRDYSKTGTYRKQKKF